MKFTSWEIMVYSEVITEKREVNTEYRKAVFLLLFNNPFSGFDDHDLCNLKYLKPIRQQMYFLYMLVVFDSIKNPCLLQINITG